MTFEVPAHLRERFAFEPGQFVTLRTTSDGGDELRRSYSICSAPHEGELQIAIKRVHDGRFSPWAHAALAPGMLLSVAPPEGRFGASLASPGAGRYLGFAAGSGITPLLSILKSVLARDDGSTFTLVYGNRASSTVMFRKELADLKDRYLDRFVLLFVMSREQQDVELFNGRIDRAKCEALFGSWIDLARVDTTLVCGPAEMTEAVLSVLAERGVGPAHVRSELFATGPRAGRRAVTVVEVAAERRYARASVLLDGRRHNFEIERGVESVLDAGLRQGVELPYSCKGGVCSSCRALLTEGEVDMDVHYALEDYEIKRGFILTCQSFPVSDRIALDLDAVALG